MSEKQETVIEVFKFVLNLLLSAGFGAGLSYLINKPTEDDQKYIENVNLYK